ncbi:MAG: orotidine-5'-phosphate decarboxylase [Actinobacteria bacterium]|nr:orotidine-5'-phosphate decarboxylase [Actinomycetota bacterium]
MSRAPIAIALDAPDLETLRAWVSQTSEYVTTMKVGLEVFCRDGHAAISAARDAATTPVDIFLDLKLHDIPATVAGAARAIASAQPRFLTVHASGGPAMIAAAAEALPDTLITAVTVLTSLDDTDLDAIGLVGPPESAVVRLAKMATAAGARALVCSPQEVAAVRHAVGAGIVLITPGVRPAGGATDDQRRVATPEQAIADGADLLVIGRPITAAADVSLAARTIAASLR